MTGKQDSSSKKNLKSKNQLLIYKVARRNENSIKNKKGGFYYLSKLSGQ